jgi:hypothetical protein
MPEATGGFAEAVRFKKLEVDFDVEAQAALDEQFPENKKAALVELLSEDPRPAYQRSADRIYGIRFAGFEIKFQVQGDHLTVVAILPLQP